MGGLSGCVRDVVVVGGRPRRTVRRGYPGRATMMAFSSTMSTLSLAASKSVAIRGDAVQVKAAKQPRVGGAGFTATANADADRLRLHNLSPLEGSRRTKKRVGRGYGAGQGGSCGLGMRGQKAKKGPGTRTGFEGGQTPMYRRFPKLRGIAGGNSNGVNKHVVVNVGDLAEAVAANKLDGSAEITLESLKSAGLIKATGFYRNLPLKVLGEGELASGLKVKAAAFSESAKAKLEAAGGSCEVIPARPKWSREAAAAAK